MSLRETAVKSTTLSELMNGRTKITTEELVGKEITLTACDIVVSDRETGEWYPIFTYAEDNTKFFNGGTVLKNIVSDWLNDLQTVKAINDELGLMGGLTVKLNRGKTKTGKTITTVEIM